MFVTRRTAERIAAEVALQAELGVYNRALGTNHDVDHIGDARVAFVQRMGVVATIPDVSLDNSANAAWTDRLGRGLAHYINGVVGGQAGAGGPVGVHGGAAAHAGAGQAPQGDRLPISRLPEDNRITDWADARTVAIALQPYEMSAFLFYTQNAGLNVRERDASVLADWTAMAEGGLVAGRWEAGRLYNDLRAGGTRIL